jgi:hypothetical protein
VLAGWGVEVGPGDADVCGCSVFCGIIAGLAKSPIANPTTSITTSPAAITYFDSAMFFSLVHHV